MSKHSVWGLKWKKNYFLVLREFKGFIHHFTHINGLVFSPLQQRPVHTEQNKLPKLACCEAIVKRRDWILEDRTLTWVNGNNENSKATSNQLCWSCAVSAMIYFPSSHICSCADTRTSTLPAQLSLATFPAMSCYFGSLISLHYLPSAVSLFSHNTQRCSPTNLLHQPSKG